MRSAVGAILPFRDKPMDQRPSLVWHPDQCVLVDLGQWGHQGAVPWLRSGEIHGSGCSDFGSGVY